MASAGGNLDCQTHWKGNDGCWHGQAHEGNTVADGSDHSDQGQLSGKSGSAGVESSVGPEETPTPVAADALAVPPSRAGVTPTGVAAMPLESLTPNYDEKHHGTYLRRLEEVVKDPTNLNIALTGRYGAGKSSVLDRFEANHRKTTQRLAISTLAPGEEGESTTNRIQKEIVKQLLYGATEKVGKNSRFTKIAVLSKRTAVLQSAGFVVCVGGLLYLLGWLPAIKWTGDEQASWVRMVAWVGAGILATLAVSVVRMLTHGRFWVSDVSAGGAALTLTEKPESFFDKYLDEIVHYFRREAKDIVVFEDLDRFEDPHIFEALRELNTLLNETPERRRKRLGNRPGRLLRWGLGLISEDLPAKVATKLQHRWATRLLGLGVPLRFVYAVRDSVFVQVDAATVMPAATAPAAGPDAAGQTQADQRLDAAAAETLRANRTKFFDIVIPLVPFISHRNARDLLLRLLEARGIGGIEPRLVNTVAQHCTDMRLMRNMCNEYLVFAERLLEPPEPNKPAPGMDASRLFALVAYKNFHLEDFENITRRDSDLDRLYEAHQQMVRETIAAKDQRKRALLAEPGRVQDRTRLATMLGQRLTTHAELVRRTSNYGGVGYRLRVGSDDFNANDANSHGFWAAVAQHQSLNITLSNQPIVLLALNKAELEVLVPESLDADRWAEYDQNKATVELADIENDIGDLRRAGFAELVTMPRFKLTTEAKDPRSSDDPGSGPRTFAQLLEATLKSKLACDLVRRGYIDRNFSLYAAQFYGKFTGVDVANFMVQHVQSNTMAIDYQLDRKGAVANLLAEAEDAGDELTKTAAAFNIDIVNHLLTVADPRASDIVGNLIEGWANQAVQTFLAAYFTSAKAEREKLAALLAEHQWREVFTYLVGDNDVPADARAALVSAAVCRYDPRAHYDLDDDVRAFITAHYCTMAAFTQEYDDTPGEQGPDGVPERISVLLERAGVVIPDLRELGERLHQLVVNANRYDLTATNLRSALGLTGGSPTGGRAKAVPLEVVQGNETVYGYCIDQLPIYLSAVDHDPSTGHAVTTAETLQTVLKDVVAGWDSDRIADPHSGTVADLLALTSPDARVPNLRAAPKSTWTALAAADRFRGSLANLAAYRAYAGTIDALLATLLERGGTVHATDPVDVLDHEGGEYDRQKEALALLNTAHIAPAVRVNLADSLDVDTPLPVESITAEPNDLFALLLDAGLVADELETFMLIRGGGWAALRPAIEASTNIGTFLEPAVVAGMVSDLLADAEAAAKVGRKVVENIEAYVPEDEWAELKAVARYADAKHFALTPATVVRIARVAHENRDVRTEVLLRLLCATSPGASADDVADVFEHLGSDYDKIRQPGAKLHFDRDDIHDQLLKLLRAGNRITRGTSRKHYSATVI